MALDRAARIRKGSEPVAHLGTLGGDRGVSGEMRFADQSVCATTTPAYEVASELTDGRHYAACHLRRDEAVASAVDDTAVEGAARPGGGAPEADD